MEKNSLKFFERLIETPSPSGFEAGAQRVWADYVKPHCHQLTTDAYGNAFARLGETARRPHIVLAGHIDELGFMVSHINDDGFLFVQGIGGIDRALFRGQRVRVHGPKGTIPGVTGSLAIHLQDPDDRKKVPELHEMYVDIGAGSRAVAEKLVRVGDSITYADGFERLQNNRVAARGCDNRIGVWAAGEALRLLSAKPPKVCVTAVSTVQEENGGYGATMAAYALKPDVALVVDVTHGTDIPNCSKPKHGDVRLGKGPVISLGSSNHPLVVQRLIEVAAKENIPVQREANPRRTGTDADAFFLQRGGIPTASLGLPNRYMHSPVEVIDLEDLAAMAGLLAAFCRSVKPGESFHVKI
ncbi:MAG: M42 family metallopeptidase [Chthoniobacterales bacterium]|nr:M42 family metallopeptidase [Chthoniobacterales bacterium]